MSQHFDIAILGVDTLGGETLLELLEEREFPVATLYPLVSTEGELDSVRFAGRAVSVESAADFDWSQVQLAFFMAGSAATEQWAQVAADAGCLVIDNSLFFRDDFEVPLVIPEVNGETLADFRQRNIVASPTCIVTELLLALKPIHDEVGIERVNLVSLQSVSGSGKSGIQELARQTAALLNGRPAEAQTYPAQIAFNLLPQIDTVTDDGFTLEEKRLESETQRLLGDERIRVNATCVRVPVFYGHSQVVHLETQHGCDCETLRRVLAEAPGVMLVEDELLTPVSHGAGQEGVFVSRLRQDGSHPRGFDFWLVTDNIRKGGALNCLQIAESLIREYL
ncbi:MAG: aspartate-semialdehyde dehydrogenase [Aeromonadaceae bacterium]|nr:aspartate-semialdehyde dehydrogenase [Aeromonadaceae bacterium]